MAIEFSRPLKIEHIDKSGKPIEIEASPDEMIALANRFDLLSIEFMNADFTVKPTDGGTKFSVKGTVRASVTQQSIVSGDSVETPIEQDITAWYADYDRVASFEKARKQKEREETADEYEIKSKEEDPERVMNGAIDLGEVAAQFLGLALDEFPRTKDEEAGSGDYIEVNPEDTKDNPFAALAQLKEKK